MLKESRFQLYHTAPWPTCQVWADRSLPLRLAHVPPGLASAFAARLYGACHAHERAWSAREEACAEAWRESPLVGGPHVTLALSDALKMPNVDHLVTNEAEVNVPQDAARRTT
jgi:hypothetical protein